MPEGGQVILKQCSDTLPDGTRCYLVEGHTGPHAGEGKYAVIRWEPHTWPEGYEPRGVVVGELYDNVVADALFEHWYAENGHKYGTIPKALAVKLWDAMKRANFTFEPLLRPPRPMYANTHDSGCP